MLGPVAGAMAEMEERLAVARAEGHGEREAGMLFKALGFNLQAKGSVIF